VGGVGGGGGGCVVVFFFFNDTATTEIYTLSLHDALPIYCAQPNWRLKLTAPRTNEPRFPPAVRCSRIAFVNLLMWRRSLGAVR